MQKQCAIAVMAKAPIAGRSKTRLVPPLSPEQAARLSGAFLSDITANIALAARDAPIDGWIAYAPSGAEPMLVPWAGPGTRLVLADGNDDMPASIQELGRCLLHAARSLFKLGYTAVCLVNSDSPTLPTTILTQAAALLLQDPEHVVLGPAEDGGYYLIGMGAPHSMLFADITWSSASVAEETRVRTKEIGLMMTELAPWYDVDDPTSLHRLAAEIGAYPNGSEFLAPITRSCLRDFGLA